MILTTTRIKEEIAAGRITWEGQVQGGPNSLDITLGDELCRNCTNDYMFDGFGIPQRVVNYQKESRIEPVGKANGGKSEGWILMPGTTYLAKSAEYFGSKTILPYLEGRSTIGRGGTKIHATAGFIDLGWFGNLVFEIEVTEFTYLEPGWRIGQIAWHEVTGELQDYAEHGHYADQREVLGFRGGNV